MSPERAAKISEAMKAMAGGHTTTDRSCLTKEDLAKDSFMLPNEGKMTCTRKIITNSRSSYAADITCTGEREMNGHIVIDSLAGGTSFKGTSNMAMTTQGKTMNVDMSMSGKFISADCGTVK